MVPSPSPRTDSISTRLFRTRLELIHQLDSARIDAEVRTTVTGILREQVASMNLDNFVVRPRRKLVEQYARPEAWRNLPIEAVAALGAEVAGLPTQLESEPEEAKRFDLLLLNLQLALLRSEPSFARLRDQVRQIASALEEYRTIPMVAAEIETIQAVQSEDWWQDVTVPMLEHIRSHLRVLVQFIEKAKRDPIYTNFEDTLGAESEVHLGVFAAAGFEQFRKKVRGFLQHHHGDIPIKKIHMGWPITPTDIAELERVLIDTGTATTLDLARAVDEAGSLGLFVRSLVGLDRQAAKDAFATYLDDTKYNSTQIEFVNLIVHELTANGIVPASRFYESPFTDVSAIGPDGIFKPSEVDDLIHILDDMRRAAAA